MNPIFGWNGKKDELTVPGLKRRLRVWTGWPTPLVWYGMQGCRTDGLRTHQSYGQAPGTVGQVAYTPVRRDGF